MSTATQTAQQPVQPVVQTFTPQPTPLAHAQEAVTGLQSYVTTPVANTMNYPKLAGTVLASYVVLEVVNHVVLGSYVMPWIISTLGLGATAAGAVFYGVLGLTALGLSWLAYKFFFKKKEVKQVNPNVTYVPVDQVQPTS